MLNPVWLTDVVNGRVIINLVKKNCSLNLHYLLYKKKFRTFLISV